MKNDNYSISVVIPMYNSEDTILRAIKSVERQDCINNIKEIIVVNDGSIDSSAKIVEDYIPKCKVKLILFNKKNGGVSSARNLGMKVSVGNWIAFLDSDDEWLPNKISKQLSIIDSDSNIAFISGNYDGQPMKIMFKHLPYIHQITLKNMCIKCISQPSTVLMLKKIFNEIGGFDEKQRYAEDGNYFMKICLYYKMVHINEQLVIYSSGKRGFGISGLSANLKGMYEGNKKNIKEMYENEHISLEYFLFLRFFYFIKYIRRIVVTMISKVKE